MMFDLLSRKTEEENIYIYMPSLLLEFFIVLLMERRKHTHTPENQLTTLLFPATLLLLVSFGWETRKAKLEKPKLNIYLR
jgi:hypothetical protein